MDPIRAPARQPSIEALMTGQSPEDVSDPRSGQRRGEARVGHGELRSCLNVEGLTVKECNLDQRRNERA